MLQPCDEWAELRVAAASAGRWAARQLALRCSAWQLGRAGEVSTRVEPGDSPVAAWLNWCGHAVPAENGSGVSVRIGVAAEDLFPADDAAWKADALLVRYAYASAYCTVLSEEAGVTTEIFMSTRQDRRKHRIARSTSEGFHEDVPTYYDYIGAGSGGPGDIQDGDPSAAGEKEMN